MSTHTTYTVQRRGYENSALLKRGSTTVAEVFTDREPGDQYEVAALLAAAPALLEALQWVTRCLERPGPHMDPQAAIERARAVIAAATGE